jgi:uncharacterized protein (TIGR00106 family)
MYGGRAQGLPERGWAVAELTVFPLGTGQPTVRDHVRALYALVQASGLKHQLTAMGTIVEGRVEDILELTRRLHDACFTAGPGASRVYTTLRLDERRGEPLSIEGKVQGVLSPP